MVKIVVSYGVIRIEVEAETEATATKLFNELWDKTHATYHQDRDFWITAGKQGVGVVQIGAQSTQPQPEIPPDDNDMYG